MTNAFESLNSNFTKTIRDGINMEDMFFKPLKDFCGKVVKVDGFFFVNSRYGKQVVVIGNGYKINMPGRSTEQFQQIMNNEKLLNLVLDGHLVLCDIEMADTKNGTTTIYNLNTI